jgi:hypothetical protein
MFHLFVNYHLCFLSILCLFIFEGIGLLFYLLFLVIHLFISYNLVMTVNCINVTLLYVFHISFYFSIPRNDVFSGELDPRWHVLRGHAQRFAAYKRARHLILTLTLAHSGSSQRNFKDSNSKNNNSN